MNKDERQRLIEIAKHIEELILVMSAEDRGYILGVAETLASTVYLKPNPPQKTA